MELREFFTEDAIKLELKGESKDDVLKELIGLLGLDDKNQATLFKMLKRRENLGSTGIGRQHASLTRSSVSAAKPRFHRFTLLPISGRHAL